MTMLITASLIGILGLYSLFVVVRPRFLRSMVAFQLGEIDHLAYSLEMRAYRGEIDLAEPTWAMIHASCKHIASIPADQLPGPVTMLVAVGMAHRETSLRDFKANAEQDQVMSELGRHVLRLFRYRSFPLWVVLKTYETGVFTMIGWLVSWSKALTVAADRRPRGMPAHA